MLSTRHQKILLCEFCIKRNTTLPIHNINMRFCPISVTKRLRSKNSIIYQILQKHKKRISKHEIYKKKYASYLNFCNKCQNLLSKIWLTEDEHCMPDGEDAFLVALIISRLIDISQTL